MVASKSRTLRIGVIAEEQNDIDVLYELTKKIIPDNCFSFKKFVAHGCGKLRRKCAVWASNLQCRGCDILVVMHDLDRHTEQSLRSELEGKVGSCGIRSRLVLIPTEEVEAWLLADSQSIKSVFNMRTIGTIPTNTETIPDPKGYLRDLVARYSKAQYLNTIHNQKLAHQMSLDAANRCCSFQPYPAFLSPPGKKKK